MEFSQVLGVVQVLSSWTTLMPMDDHPTRYNHSCLFDLDNFHGRIGVGSIFNSPSKYILEVWNYLNFTPWSLRFFIYFYNQYINHDIFIYLYVYLYIMFAEDLIFLVGSNYCNLESLYWLNKRFNVQSPPTPKTDRCLSLMIKSYH